ncbi:MAG TPA: cation transporter [Amycolatopsis sp.]|nr:cation transporter [Amycolatopsis sp.]
MAARNGSAPPACQAPVRAVAVPHGTRRSRRRHGRDPRGLGRPARLRHRLRARSLASIIIVWRFSGTRTLSETAERRAQIAVAISFFLLAPYLAYAAITRLLAGQHPETSWAGIVLSAFSPVWMPVLGVLKKRLGVLPSSEATAGEGGQNLLCAHFAAAVLVGLLANTLFGWWWLDPAVGLLIAGLAVREGIEVWRSDDCC